LRMPFRAKEETNPLISNLDVINADAADSATPAANPGHNHGNIEKSHKQ